MKAKLITLFVGVFILLNALGGNDKKKAAVPAASSTTTTVNPAVHCVTTVPKPGKKPTYSSAPPKVIDTGANTVYLPNVVRRFFGYHSPAIIQNLGQVATVVTATYQSFDGTAPSKSFTRTRSAQLRPSQLRAAPLKDAADWLGAYHRFWEAGFGRLEERLGSQ